MIGGVEAKMLRYLLRINHLSSKSDEFGTSFKAF